MPTNTNTPTWKRSGRAAKAVGDCSAAAGGRSLVPGPWPLVLALGCLLVSGCTSPELVRVKPWQRATLADYTMRPDRDPLNTAMAEHVYFSRETASGGRGVGGSGCGCN